MKKIFGELKLTWPKVIIAAVLIGIYCGLIGMNPKLTDTSFKDINVSFEVWILFGILIIMNSKSNKDSALKCFVFFLISQPLIYLVQDFFNHSQLFNTYYRFWIIWTIACLPMGYFGYYLKKDKWWGLLILSPIMLLVGYSLMGYYSECAFSFPRHLLTVIFCVATLIIYPLYIFKNKKIKRIGLIINSILIVVMISIAIIKPYIYETDVFSNSEEHPFNDKYKVYFDEEKYGELSIVYDENIEDWLLQAKFKRAGKTKFVLESPNGKKQTYELKIWRTKTDYKKIKE